MSVVPKFKSAVRITINIFMGDTVVVAWHWRMSDSKQKNIGKKFIIKKKNFGGSVIGDTYELNGLKWDDFYGDELMITRMVLTERRLWKN